MKTQETMVPHLRALKRKKSPMAIRPPGEMKGFIMDIPRDGATTMTPSFDGLSPI
jgi:hypothetical protein